MGLQVASDAVADARRAGLAVVADPLQALVTGADQLEAHGLAFVPAGELLAEAIAIDPPASLVIGLGEAAEA